MWRWWSACIGSAGREPGRSGEHRTPTVVGNAVTLGHAVSRRSGRMPQPIVRSERRLKRPVRTGGLVALILALLVAATPPTLALKRPEVRDRVIPTAVQIAITGEVTDNGVTGPLALPMGSGTIVSATGHILTAAHVVDMTSHRRMLDSLETQAAADGHTLSFELDLESVLIATSDGLSPPHPRYTATIAAAEPVLDLAVLQIVGDGTAPLDPASLNLPFVPLGDWTRSPSVMRSTSSAIPASLAGC